MSKPTYLISQGINELLENRYDLGLSIIAKDKIQKLEEEFTEQLGKELESQFSYETISPKEIRDAATGLFYENQDPVINLDDIYFNNANTQGDISITRLVTDVNRFDQKTLGPRKGFPPLEEQMKKLAENYAGQNVALLDVRIFEGETLLSKENGIIPLLKKMISTSQNICWDHE